MEIYSKIKSLKFYVLLLVSATLVTFALIFFFIFQMTMPRMLLETEQYYLSQQINLVNGLLKNSRENIALLAEDTATWEETVRFVQGENPNFIANNWPSKSLLESFRMNFIIIKDLEGNDVYTNFLNHHTNESMQIPRGLSGRLNEFAENVAFKYTSQLSNLSKHGKEGILFYNRDAYNVAIMPIIPSRDATEPSGILILGNVLDNKYFQALIQHRNGEFAVEEDTDVSRSAKDSILLRDQNTVSIQSRLVGIDGKPLILTLTEVRKMYAKGRGYISQANCLILAAILLFGAAIYQVVIRLVLNPVANLGNDIKNIAKDADIENANIITEKYSNSSEFSILCDTINSMIKKLGQSQISLSTLQRVLNGIDAYLYAVDADNDTILFMNEKMQQHYKIGNPIGQVCWKTLQEGFTERCSFCPREKILATPGVSYVWEEHSSLTKRQYRNADTIIQWTDGRMVHLQYSVDITEIKQVESSLKKRLKQQELMAKITRSFIATTSVTERIDNALHMAGEFLNISKIVLAQRQHDVILQSIHEWNNEADGPIPKIPSIPFMPGTPEHDNFIVLKRPYLAYDDISGMEEFSYPWELGARSMATIPVYIFGKFWGILNLSKFGQTKHWSESDIQLLTLIGTIISGVVERGIQEKELVRMSSIVESAPQFIAYTALNGKLKYVNRGSESALGYTQTELLDGGIALLLDSESYSTAVNKVFPRIVERGSLSFEMPFILKNGELRTFSCSSFAINQDQETGIGIITQDVTEQRTLQKEIVTAKEQAEKSSLAKSEFLSRMSHEMRTPLSAIIGMTNIATAAEGITKKQYCLDKISEASIHLLGVINDILDMAKIEANKFELSYTEFSFDKMLMRVINVVNFRIEEKGQHLAVNVSPDIPYAIIGDEQRLAQVITNLVGNAVKFTPENGTITITANKLDEKDGRCTLCVSISDTGIGISPENQAKLFKSFEQADGGISRKFGGTGLGLSISKQIVGLMGGEIWVTSEADKGSRFSFTITVQRGIATSENTLTDLDWRSLRTLVVDDAPEIGEYFKKLAANIGFSCTVTSNACDALEALKKEGKNSFDIVFIDREIPGMGGVELAREIAKGEEIPPQIVMISSAEWSDIEEKAREAGVRKFVSKPLFAAAIVDTVNEIMGKQKDADQAGDLVNSGNFSGVTILLAEDVAINREIVLTMLGPTDISIDCAVNGAEACEKFHATPDKYSMIFMDIHMPEVDGYDATRRIRGMDDIPWAKQIPIIAMTANVFREDIERCLKAGMNDHIGKPIDFDILLQKLRAGCAKK